nr:sulfatase-like hydrolase/transferase [Streptococcus massiliensis]
MGNLNHARYKSLSFVWFNQLAIPVMDEPKNYNATTIKKIEEKYKKLATKINAVRKENLENQTVIYLLSESFSDPTRVEGITVSENPIPYIQEVKSKFTSGLMKFDGYGGGTANMEFQTLTGLPFYNLSPNVSVIYTEVFPQMKYIPTISDVYKSTNRIAIHLASGSNYSRDYIYRSLKFNDFLNTDNKKTSFKSEGSYPSDASTY